MRFVWEAPKKHLIGYLVLRLLELLPTGLKKRRDNMAFFMSVIFLSVCFYYSYESGRKDKERETDMNELRVRMGLPPKY